jgi:hypothetical protein
MLLSAVVTGFDPTTSWTLNGDTNSSTFGVPAISSTGTQTNNDLTLTNQNGSEASTAWYNTAVSYLNFTASFTYTAIPNNPPADGFAFVLQNSTGTNGGTAALGGSGGSIGYSGITPSFGVSFNIYNGSHTGDNFNGGGNSNVSTTGTVNLTSGDPINMTLAYNSTALSLSESLTDTTTGATYFTTFKNVNLPTQLGASTALMGFTGGTGGANAQQDITNFVYSTNASPPPPVGLISGFSSFSLNGANGAGVNGSATTDNNNGASPKLSTDNNTLTLTTAATNQASSAFYTIPDSYGNFTASFTYQESGGTTPPGNGFTFVLQDDSRGANALGGGAENLGYSTDAAHAATAISPSVAAEFNMNGVSSVSVTANGANTVSSTTSNTGSVNLASGDPIKISFSYNSSSLTETLTDTTTNATFTTTYNNVNIPSYLGIDTAFVGFTAGTGANNALQTISNFTYTPNTSVPPPPTTSPVSGFANFTLNAADGKGVDGGNPGDNNNGAAPKVSTDNNTLTVTTAANGQASSAFFNTPVGYQNFSASFTYTDTLGTPPADGIAFVLQDDPRGVNALGGGGGQLGYGTDAGHPASPISPSFAVEFNVYQVSTTSVGTNGAATVPYGVANTGSVNLASGDPINVSLSYNSVQNTLVETLKDATTNATYSTLFSNVNLNAILLANSSATLGFTGATGGANSQQTISNFAYSTSANEPLTPTPPTPVNSVTGFTNFMLDAGNATPAGVPSISADNGTLTATTAIGNESTTAFYQTPVTYGNFNAAFTYTETGAGPADGITFTLQNTPGLGGTGGLLGYGNNIPNSFAVEFNVYQVSSVSIGAGGAVTVPYFASNTGSVNLASGNPISVTLAYNSANQTLTETLTDATASTTDSTTYNNVNLSQYIGSNAAYLGFTGGTGGANSLETISNFTYTASASSVTTSSAPQVNLTGYYSNYGIGLEGSPSLNGGYDGGGNSLSTTFFGASQTVTAGGTTQTFNFAPGGTLNSINASGQTINLPQGKYGNISLLGSAANGPQTNQVFTISYTDGTSQSFTQSLSDWWAPATTFPGESVAISMPYHLDNTGAQGTQGTNQPININEYQFALNPAKTVASITLPNDGNDKFLAINVNAAPVVASVSPNTGPPAGGTVVTITGTGFTGETAVNFGSNPATNVTVNSAGTQITATDPAGTGTVDVTVVGPYGTSVTSPADKFTYASSLALVGNPVINGDNPNGLFTDPGQTANGGQRSMVEDVVYTFNQAVTIPNANTAFTVAVAGSKGTVPTTLIATAVAGSNGTQWAVTLSGKAAGVLGSIANGEYSITINPSFVFAASDGTTPLGSGRTDTFYRLFGDINGDRVVNAADNLKLKTALVTYNSAFDSNGDGFINAADNLQFKGSQSTTFLNDGFITTI